MLYGEALIYNAWLWNRYRDETGATGLGPALGEDEPEFYRWRVSEVGRGRNFIAEWRENLHA